MADPIGENTYLGLAVPLYGESQIVQQNSSNVIITFMHSSDNTGRFLVGRDMPTSADALAQYSSILGDDNMQFEIDADGYMRKMSGTTVISGFDSSGVHGGLGTSVTVWNIDSSGRWAGLKRTVVNLSSASTAVSMQTSVSGGIYRAPTPSTADEDYLLSLPASSLAPVGTEFDVVIEPTTKSTAVQVTASLGSSDIIFLAGIGDSTVDSCTAVAPISTGGAVGKFVLVSTNRWQLFPYPHSLTSALTTDYGTTDMEQGWTTAAGA